MTLVSADWFRINPKHSLVGSDGYPRPHLFFDVVPEISRNERFVNAVLVTPQGSDHAYEIDLNSGQRFYSHTYCSQKDIWNHQPGTFKNPPYGIGLIPRVLDQLGTPQKVLILSSRNLTETFETNYYRVKIVGGFIEQECLEGNCLGKQNWLSRLVLIGADIDDKEQKELNTLADFTKKYTWEDVKAYLENIDGRNFMGSKTYPAIRIGALIPAEEAFAFYKGHSIIFSNKESEKIQKGCHDLYDKLLNIASTSIKQNEFSRKLTEFTQKYYPEIATCEKFVYHGNVNEDPEKFWYLSYLQIFFRMHKDGYVFDCVNKNWQKNLLDKEGNFVFDLKRDIVKCKDRDIDQAMVFLPNFLRNIKDSGNFYYKFIDYDNHPYGTHKKMFSWVKNRAKKMDCSNDPNEKMKKALKVFPEDISWKKREVSDEQKEKDKIIY